jgi:choline dehydrogenase
MPKNLADGVRMNGAFTYLAPVRSHPNLTIAANCLVDRIEFDGGRAVAVTTASGDSFAAGEIVLSAGAYGSPAILLRSGVGPAADLERLDVPRVADLPGVGEHLLDHPLVSLDLPKPAAIKPDFAPGRRSFMPVGVKARSRQTGEEVDLHIYVGQDFDTERSAWFFWVSISLQNGLSHGRVRLTSRDPKATLHIDHQYFDEPEDLEALADGVELALSLLGTDPLASKLVTGPEFTPLWRNREGLRAWLRGRVGTTFHPSSTCRMGPAADPLAVVDVAGNVHGVTGLRVVDASIFPDVVRANPHFTIVAAAEKIAECMR